VGRDEGVGRYQKGMKNTQAIILKIENYRERDERICLYTKDFGKITVVARGVKRIEAKLRGNLDIFNYVDISFVDGAGLPILTAIDMHRRFHNLAQDYVLYRSALGIVAIVSDVFQEGAGADEFFNILHNALRELDEGGELSYSERGLYSWSLLKRFQLDVLNNQGYSMENPFSFSKSNFKDIENLFVRTFAYQFNYKIPSWIPN